ncbi:MAG: SDR family oxidoreductase [Candidatus Omnitrophota bacterium]
MNKTEKKICVTGGAGFIGSHLVERLILSNHHVIVVDNFSTGRYENLPFRKNCKNLSIINADVADPDKMINCFKGVEIVFHCAALADIVPSIVHPDRYYRSNVTGTFCVAEAARKAQVKKFIYTASSSCYGIATNLPTKESDPIDPQYPYALTKYLGEQITFHWGKVYGLPVVSLRLFNVYGPRSRTSGTYGAVSGVFLAQKLAGKPYTVVGDGTQTRDFIYVSDVVEAFLAAAFSDIKNEIFNVGCGNPQSVNTLVSLLGGEKVHIPKRPGEPDCTWADIAKIKNKLDWQPKISFEEGIGNILQHIQDWRSAPVWTPEKIEEATKDWFTYLAKEKP